MGKLNQTVCVPLDVAAEKPATLVTLRPLQAQNRTLSPTCPYQTRATSVHRAEAPRNRSTKSGHRLRFRIRQPARLLHVRRPRRPARRAAWIGRELERLVDSTAEGVAWAGE